ncbi:inositol hexakisphosphate-domain-containing protein [Boletus edulis]|nr:inositol hexakisphosphate-domain-containing protein [Boletus edulis]
MSSPFHDPLDPQRGPGPTLMTAPPARLDKAVSAALLVDNADTNNAVVSLSKDGVQPLDLMASLKRAEPSVVKTRTGSVLSRGFILKTDHYPSGRALDLDLNVHGAPNFRAPRQGNLNVFGVAQPRTQGLRAILSALRCRPGMPDPSHVVWFSTREEPIVYISGRPFVLRDASEPRKTLSLSDRAENLEAIEDRLKHDILQEATKYGGLILTHNELANAAESGEGAILPTWTNVDNVNVRTSHELWENMRLDGWSVEPATDPSSIPISPDRPIEDNYLDAYLRVIKDADPVKSALVFSCGMGAVRTTFAMVAALIVRRRMLLARGLNDPYATKPSFVLPAGHLRQGTFTPVISTPRSQPGTDMKLAQALENASAQQDLNSQPGVGFSQYAVLDLHSQSAIALLMSQPVLLENLRRAHQGNYGVILSLLGCLDHGLQAKKLVDRVIDTCDHVTNLREDILVHRVRYSLTTPDDDSTKREDMLVKAGRSLEKYFFMIAFASYVDSDPDFSQTFSDWLKARTEIWNQVMFLRKSRGSRLNVFAPVNDLSLLSRSEAEDKSLVAGQKNDVEIAGGQLLGDEFSDHCCQGQTCSDVGEINHESSLRLESQWHHPERESDQWLSESQRVLQSVRGVINFRNIPGTNIYACGQPTESAIDQVVRLIKEHHPNANKIVWVTLREEPIRYSKNVSGTTVIMELNAFDGRLLLHTETADGSVIPIWEEVQPEDVAVLKDIMASRRSGCGIEVQYTRIPITAERSPDMSDICEVMELVARTDLMNAAIVMNCQLGRGRSTLTSVLMLLIQQWLKDSRLLAQASPRLLVRSRSHSTSVLTHRSGAREPATVVPSREQSHLRLPSHFLNLRDSIEEEREKAEQATDEKQKRVHTAKGLHNLRRYFELVVFQAYLQSTEADTLQSVESFEKFVENRPVIKTFKKDLDAGGLDALIPLERIDGVAHPDEVKQVVANRSGSILSASTILKSDFFSNLQKMTLPESQSVYVAGRPHVLRLVDKPLENVEATGVTTVMVETMEERFKKDVLRELRQGGGRILLHDEVEERPGVFTIIPIWETVAEGDIMTPRDVFDLVANEGYKIDYDRVAITDEQAPLPDALFQLLNRIRLGYSQAGDFIFNCQMGRGRTTTGMVTACLISTIMNWVGDENVHVAEDMSTLNYDSMDGPSEEEAYLQGITLVFAVDIMVNTSAGEYKTILQLVGVLSHGKIAKRLTDRAIDLMQDVQNLRKAIYDYKLKVEACEKGSVKQGKLMNIAVNYLYRYGTLIVFCNYLIEMRESTGKGEEKPFPAWLREHREIAKLLGRRSLD